MLCAGRVLGMSWKPKEDILTVAVKSWSDIQLFISGSSVPTKPQVLRIVITVFNLLCHCASFDSVRNLERYRFERMEMDFIPFQRRENRITDPDGSFGATHYLCSPW